MKSIVILSHLMRASIKQFLLGTFADRFLFWFRDKFELIWAVFSNPVAVISMTNDQLAMSLLTNFCSSDGLFIDVGAHLGSVVSRVTRKCPTVRIIAIEAIPLKVSKLKRKFPHAQIHSCAVGKHSGKAKFYINTRNTAYSSLIKPNTSDYMKEIVVPVRALDCILSNEFSNAIKIDVIKIDVEGAELNVLMGAINILDRCRPIVLFESGPVLNGKQPSYTEDIWLFFSNKDYDIVLPSRISIYKSGLSQDNFVEAHFYPCQTTNYFAIPCEKKKYVQHCSKYIFDNRFMRAVI